MAESISQYPMVDKFLRYLQVEKNTSPLTVKNYAADISLFSNFLAERLGKDFQWQKIGVLDIRVRRLPGGFLRCVLFISF